MNDIKEDMGTVNAMDMSLQRNVSHYTTCLGKKKNCKQEKCKCTPIRRPFLKDKIKEEEMSHENNNLLGIEEEKEIMKDIQELTESLKGKRKKKENDEKEKKWIQGAIQKEGAFTNYCKRKGFTGVTDECIRMGLQSKDKTIQRRANLAKTLRKMA
jgi:hypothetical protein